MEEHKKILRNYIRNIINESIVENINVFRGGTKQYDEFDMNKIGSGDGGSKGGWGIYCSDSREVASRYFLQGGIIKEFSIPDGDYFDLDESLDEWLGQNIMSALEKRGINENELEQFQTDFIDYIPETYNNQVYDWLSYVLGSEKNASLFLESMGFKGNRFKDKWDSEATNYVLFDNRYVIKD